MSRVYWKRIICILLCLAMLTGCGYVSGSPFDTRMKGNGDSEFTTLGLDPEFDYEVPESLPSILVNQVGYDIDSSKVAFFCGDLLPNTFSIIDAQSGKSVYTGRIKTRGYDEKTGVSVSYGDFTTLQKTGTYYIEAAIIGQSYSFEISDNPYEELYNVAVNQ